jgi:indole-3-glycerol phosphate synthase
MNLQSILEVTRQESEERRSRVRLESLRQRILDMDPTRGFARALSTGTCGVIAEIKTKSPSMGRMSPGAEATAAAVHRIYAGHPVVSALSILTQRTHFGGSPEHLRRVRKEVSKPILRKDFIWDEYEVYFSRAIDADAILLMANVVTDPVRFAGLHDLATGLGLDVLCEVHTERELEVLPPGARICGINSRNFRSSGRFLLSRLARLLGRDVSVDTSAFELFGRLPPGVLRVAESGLNADNIGRVLERHPFEAALIGTSLLKNGLEGVPAELDRIQAAIAAVRKA